MLPRLQGVKEALSLIDITGSEVLPSCRVQAQFGYNRIRIAMIQRKFF